MLRGLALSALARMLLRLYCLPFNSFTLFVFPLATVQRHVPPSSFPYPSLLEDTLIHVPLFCCLDVKLFLIC